VARPSPLNVSTYPSFLRWGVNGQKTASITFSKHDPSEKIFGKMLEKKFGGIF
jgi:hypothetical protein